MPLLSPNGTQTAIELLLRVVQGNRPPILGCGMWLGHALGLECHLELLSNGKRDASDPWHTGSSHTTSNCGQVAGEVFLWEFKWLAMFDCYIGNDNKDCGIYTWILLSALEYMTSSGVLTLTSSHGQEWDTFHISPKRIISYSHCAIISRNQAQDLVVETAEG
jgi:hypothetical protein